jgi:hypothetical protein
MGPLDNPRREIFAQLRAKGIPQRDAYMDAGFEGENVNSQRASASRLNAEPEVIARIKELQERASTRVEMHRADILSLILESRTLAMEIGQPAAAIRAAELIGKDIGMFTDKKEVRIGALEDADVDEIKRIRDAIAAEQARRIEVQVGSSSSREEDRSLLPRPGAVAAGTIPETS